LYYAKEQNGGWRKSIFSFVDFKNGDGAKRRGYAREMLRRQNVFFGNSVFLKINVRNNDGDYDDNI
jgi:hypothetical protein